MGRLAQAGTYEAPGAIAVGFLPDITVDNWCGTEFSCACFSFAFQAVDAKLLTKWAKYSDSSIALMVKICKLRDWAFGETRCV
jgi:hypothetical protein